MPTRFRLRVLPGGPGETANARRETVYTRGTHGMLSVAGGKLTTYRRIALDALEQLGVQNLDRTPRPLPGATCLGRIDWPGRTSIIYVDDVADVMIDLAGRPEAAGEIVCLASDESHTVGEIARIVGRGVGHPVRPLRVPQILWSAGRAVVWNRAVAAALPPPLRLSFWRLSLIISDGFWFDTAKLRRLYKAPIRNLEQGLADTLRT